MWDIVKRHVGFVGLGDVECTRPAEDNYVQERVCAESVGAVHADTGTFAGCVEAWDGFYLCIWDVCPRGSVATTSKHLAFIVRRYPAHAVMNRRNNRNRIPSNVNPREN